LNGMLELLISVPQGRMSSNLQQDLTLLSWYTQVISEKLHLNNLRSSYKELKKFKIWACLDFLGEI
jgi:hypothetical protein